MSQINHKNGKCEVKMDLSRLAGCQLQSVQSPAHSAAVTPPRISSESEIVFLSPGIL